MESSQAEMTIKESSQVSNKIAETFRKNVNLSSEINTSYLLDKNDEEAVRTFRNLLESINKDPESLLNLPIIPIPIGMENEFNQEENKKDQILKKFVEETDYNNHEYEKWLTDHDVEPAAIYTRVDADDIVLAAKFSDRLAHAISTCGLGTETDTVKVSLKTILEKVREYSVDEYYVDEIKKSALEEISTFYPDLITENQLVIVPEPNFYAYGMHVDMYRNKHYIILNTSLENNPYLRPNSKNKMLTEFDKSTLIHEIIHARQSEILGNNPRLTRPLEDLIDINTDDPHEISKQLISTINDPQNHNINTNHMLLQDVLEGEAITGQLAICREKMLRTKDNDTQNGLQYVQTQLLNILTNRDVDGKKDQCSQYQFYRKGYDIIHPLQKEFGIQNLVSILSDVDITKLANIPKDSSEEKKVIGDPRLIPGLDKNPYIEQSLKRTPP